MMEFPMDEEMDVVEDFDRPPRNPGPGIRVLDFVRINMPKFRRLFSDWITTEFNEKQQNVVLEKSKRIEKLFINLPIDLDPLFRDDGLKFFEYIRVAKTLPPPIMDKYLDAMVVTPVDIDLERTSKILLDHFNIENYRRQKLTNQRRADLSRVFTPAQVETLLKFLPTETRTIIRLNGLEKSKQDFIRKLTNLQMEFYKKIGATRLRRMAEEVSILRRELTDGTSRMSRNCPELTRMSWAERQRLFRFMDSNRGAILSLNDEEENLIGELNKLGPNEIEKYRKLTREERNFLRVINREELGNVINFQERPMGSLILDENQKKVVFKVSGLSEEERRVYDTIPEIFDKSSEREMEIWKILAPLTDEEIDKLTSDDLDLIAVNPKLSEPKMLREYVKLDSNERTKIINSHTESGREVLTPFGDFLLHSYIGTNLAPTVWSKKNPQPLFDKLKREFMKYRMTNTKILSAAAAMQSENLEKISKELLRVGESPLVYYVRVMQFSRSRHWEPEFVRNLFSVYSAPYGGTVFNYADPDDVEFVESMCRDSLRYEDINMIGFFMTDVARSDKENLHRIMRTGLTENEYRIAKLLLPKRTVNSNWFAKILKPEEIFELLRLRDTRGGAPGMSFFEISVKHDRRDLVPMLEEFNTEQLVTIFEENPIPVMNQIGIMELLYDKVENFSNRLSRVLENLSRAEIPNDVIDLISDFDHDLFGRVTARFGAAGGGGCGNNRRKRQLGFDCVDSRNEKTEFEELYKTIGKVEGVADNVGFYYTVFVVGKHIANGNVPGISLDVLNIWAMPNIGKLVTSKMLEAESPLLRMGGPVVGRVVGNLFAFVGLYSSVQEYKNAKDNFDKAIAGLHFMSNSVYIGSLWAGPYGIAISVAVFITSDIMQGILRMEQLDEEIHLTWGEKFDYLWHSFLGINLPDYLTRDLEGRKYYTKFIENVLSSYGKDYDRVVIFLPNILVTERDYVSKTSSNPLLQAWYDSFEHACKSEKKIVASQFFYEIQSILKDFFNNDGLISRIIPDRVNGYYLTFGPTMEDVIEHPVSWSISEVDPSEKCLLMEMNQVMEANDTVKEWALEKNVIAYNRFGNSPSTMYYIPIMTAELELFHNKPIDVYFEGRNINITGHGEPTTNKFYFTNNLTRCDIRTQGTNLFYIKKNNFACNLTGGYNVGIVRADFEDAKDLNEIVGSEDTEELTISYAKRVDGRGGNDTIIGNNYTIVQSHWGDLIIGKTLTILPLKVNEIDKIVYDKGFIIYNDKNEFVAVDEQSMIKTLDSFVLTPSKIGNEIHVHKFVEKNVTLAEGLKELKGIRNKKFKIVKQLSSGNYEIMLGDSGHNVFYPEKEFVNFYWEGTKDVYVFPRINANVTISRANGVLDFQLLPNAYDKTVIEREKNNDLLITYEKLRIRVLNNYRDIIFAMDNNQHYKLKNWKLVRDYCTKPFEITGDGMVNANDLIHSYNCLDFKSKRIMFFKVKKNLLLTSGRSSLLIYNYNEAYFDLAVRVDGKILITPDEFRERVEKSNIMNLYKIKEGGIEIFHNQPMNQNKIGLMDFGDRSINDFRGVIRDKDLNIVYKDKPLVVIRNWMVRPEARKIMFVFQDRAIDNGDCIVNDDCKPGAILHKFPCNHEESNDVLSNDSNSTIFQSQICKDNVALVCLLVQHFMNKKCPLPKFRSYGKNICAEAFRIVKLIKRQLKKSGNSVEVGEDYSLYERIVEDMRNGNYSIKDILKADNCGQGFFDTLKRSVENTSNMLFK